MKKKLLSLGIATFVIVGQSISAFASDNICSSKYNIDIENIKANAVSTIISSPTTIVNYNGNEYYKGNKNSIEKNYNINYDDIETTVINTIIVSPDTIVDINVPLAGDFKPKCFDKLNN